MLSFRHYDVIWGRYEANTYFSRSLCGTIIIGISRGQIFLKESLLVDNSYVHLSVTLRKSLMLTFWQDTVHPAGDICSLSCQTLAFCKICFSAGLLSCQTLAFCKICFSAGLFVYLFIYFLTCYNIFQVSTSSVDDSFRAIALKLAMLTREPNSCRCTKS